MADRFYTLLEGRGILGISGKDARSFLQGLISNGIEKVNRQHAIYAAMLTPQGKYLHDFFIAETPDALLLDCEGPRLEDLKKRLVMYRLRAKAEIEDQTCEYAAAALFGDGTHEGLGLSAEPGSAAAFNTVLAGGAAYVDPRLAACGARAILPRDGAAKALEDAGFAPAPFADYDQLRMGLGLPDGSRDMVVEKAILLENGFDEMGAADWKKGCYLGQELTARTKYRGLIKKRLVPVDIDGPAPGPGTPITLNDAGAGEMRSSSNGLGLALLRLEAMEKGGAFMCGAAKLTPSKPDWMDF